MRRPASLTQRSAFIAGAITLYAILRASVSIGRPIARFADTPGYESLRFIGSIDRFWPVPFVFHLVQPDTMRVVAHIGVGIVAWTWLALVLSRVSRYSLALFCAVLFVGLAPQVTRYDLAILSESLGISFAVMAVAATVSLARAPSNGKRVVWCMAITACAMTRPVQLIILFACAAWCAIRFIKSSRLTLAVPTAVLGLLSVWGVALLQGNHPTSMLNFYTVLAERVVPDDARYAWFTSHGMPDIPGVRQSEGYDFAGALEPNLASIVSLPVGQAPPAIIRAGGMPLAIWVRDHGWVSYAKYVLSHPADSWSRITSLATPTLSPHNDDFLPLEARTVVPRIIFGDWRVWTLVGLAAMALVLLRSKHESLLSAMLAMYSLAFVVHVAALFASGIEHPRHSVTVAVILRVLPLVAVSIATAARPLTTPDEFVDAPS